MEMNSLSQAIETAVQDCINYGNGEASIGNDKSTTIKALFEEWEEDSEYIAVTVYIYLAGVIKFSYQLEETISIND